MNKYKFVSFLFILLFLVIVIWSLIRRPFYDNYYDTYSGYREIRGVSMQFKLERAGKNETSLEELVHKHPASPFAVYYYGQPQRFSSYDTWRKNVTLEYAQDLGLSRDNFVNELKNSKPPYQRIPLWALSAKSNNGADYCYLTTQVVNQNFRAPTMVILKREGKDWKIHGRDDLGLVLSVPLDNWEKLKVWVSGAE